MELEEWFNPVGSFLFGMSLTYIFGIWKGITLAIAILLIKEEMINRISKREMRVIISNDPPYIHKKR